MTSEPTVTKRTFCRICTNLCGMVVEVNGDRIVKVRGDRQNSLSKGYSCPKGRAMGEMHHHPEAISQPLMRKNGELVAVSWDECLDDIAERFHNVIDECGPGAVGVNFGSGLGMDASGWHMADVFHRAVGTPAKFTPTTIDGTAKIMVASTVGGFPGFWPKPDYDNVEMLLYVGINPIVSHGHNSGMMNPAATIRGIAARGEVWTIDPLFTETAKFSTRHIAPIPGKDHAILAWLTREILDGGPIAPAQPVQGMEELRAALDGFDLAMASVISGVPEQDMTDLLAAIRRKGHVVVETGTGTTMARSANVTQWFAWVINILTGRTNRKGGNWFHPGFINRFDNGDLPIIDNPFIPGAPTMPEVKGLITEWPCAALPGEIEAGNIRALMNFGGSMMRSFPDTNVLSRALAKLEINVDFEIIPNETTALSTHVLPSKDQTERSDISSWDMLLAGVGMVYTEPMVRPMGERRSSWWIIAQIMKRMGLDVPGYVPDDDRQQGADPAMLAQVMTGARCSFEEVATKGYVEFPLEFPAKWFDDHIARMGGWKLAPTPLVEFWHEIRREDEARMGEQPALRFIARRQRCKLNSALSYLGSPADIILHPVDADANGIAHGDRVRVSTMRGEIFLTANVSDTMRPGVASIPHGHEVANVNNLTSVEHVDPLGGMVQYTGIPIEVAPAPA